jgi:hypothetical protein
MSYLQDSRRLGPFNLLLYLLDRLLRKLSGGRLGVSVYWICAQPVAPKAYLPPHRGRNIEVREIESHSPDLARLPRAREVLAERFGQGGRCLAAFADGRFAGFAWFNVDSYREDEVRCDFRWTPAQACAWDYDIFVEPDFRGGLVFARLWDEMNARYRDLGVRWSLSRISVFKPESLASHGRLGLRRLGRASFLQLGSWQIASSRFGRRWHFSRSAADRYELVVPVS